jgi:hypothetical protein
MRGSKKYQHLCKKRPSLKISLKQEAGLENFYLPFGILGDN